MVRVVVPDERPTFRAGLLVLDHRDHRAWLMPGAYRTRPRLLPGPSWIWYLLIRHHDVVDVHVQRPPGQHRGQRRAELIDDARHGGPVPHHDVHIDSIVVQLDSRYRAGRREGTDRPRPGLRLQGRTGRGG